MVEQCMWSSLVLDSCSDELRVVMHNKKMTMKRTEAARSPLAIVTRRGQGLVGVW